MERRLSSESLIENLRQGSPANLFRDRLTEGQKTRLSLADQVVVTRKADTGKSQGIMISD